MLRTVIVPELMRMRGGQRTAADLECGVFDGAGGLQRGDAAAGVFSGADAVGREDSSGRISRRRW